MRKIQLIELRHKIVKCLHIGELARVYLLNDGRILKLFDIQLLELLKASGIDIEAKILDSNRRKLPNEILRPNTAVYNGFIFCGDISDLAKGINYNLWNKQLTLEQRSDLFMYADIHTKLESIVSGTPDIIYPDICTCDNIYVDINNGNRIQLIDYDGLQIGRYPSVTLSTTLGEHEQYFGSKKYMTNKLFTKELDKKSLILLYFLTTFNVDLNKVGQRNSYTDQIVTLDNIFTCINLNDYDIMHKVWQIFNEKKHNEWLGEDVFKLAEEYKLEVFPIPVSRNIYLKKLVKK